MNNIQMIDVNRLHPHPDNPRKDVGDVTELADSVKHSGVMQNLTVVPYEGDYRVIIGHRRLAAAKEAGLTELPCRVVEMTEREQVATMIAENMQRADLTVPEQVRGIQMMLDLGESLEDVQKKTGLSRSTVYHRKAMAALPADELQKSWERGGTIADYIALEQIKDQKERERLLEVVGTPNFNYKLTQAKRDEEYAERLEEVLLKLEPEARRLEKDLNCGCTFSFWITMGDWKAELQIAVAKIQADKEGEYGFYIGSDSWNRDRVHIYRMNEEEDKKSKKLTEAELKEESRKARRRALEDLHQQFKELRAMFIARFKETDQDVRRILPLFLREGCYINPMNVMRDIFGAEGEYDVLLKEYENRCDKKPGRVMLAAMELERENVINWYAGYNEPDEEDIVKEYLQLLVSLGYQESDAEKAYWNGTHELFLKEEDKS